jgi:hypothetical protein
LAASTTTPTSPEKNVTNNKLVVVPDRSPNNQKVNERILVASINVVMNTIAEDKKVVTMTPASIKRSGVAPARPRAS